LTTVILSLSLFPLPSPSEKERWSEQIAQGLSSSFLPLLPPLFINNAGVGVERVLENGVLFRCRSFLLVMRGRETRDGIFKRRPESITGPPPSSEGGLLPLPPEEEKYSTTGRSGRPPYSPKCGKSESISTRAPPSSLLPPPSPDLDRGSRLGCWSSPLPSLIKEGREGGGKEASDDLTPLP